MSPRAPAFRLERAGGEGLAVQVPADLSAVATAGRVTVSLGAVHARASAVAGAPDREIRLSDALAEQLHLPAGLSCQVRAEPGRLLLGPAVGIVGGRKPGDLSPWRLEALANHLLTRGSRGGLFVVTDRESIDIAGRAVTGYRWAPGKGWEPGVYPLPAVLFRRYGVALPDDLLGALELAGVRTFNERIFHKGEAARWLAADPLLRPHLPETEPLKGPGTVLGMLERHPAVFVKPAWGSLAEGILRIRREADGYTLEPSRGEAVSCPDGAALTGALRGRLPGSGLVQQGLELAAAGGRMVDFRVVVQKDGAGDWTVSGIVGRCGEDALFVSNMATGGFPLPAPDALALLFGPSPVTHYRRMLELRRVGLAAARALDRGGLVLGDLGLDLAYDTRGHLWVIEANNRDPDHNIGWEAGSWPLFYRFRTLPLDYACHLAGFGGES